NNYARHLSKRRLESCCYPGRGLLHCGCWCEWQVQGRNTKRHARNRHIVGSDNRREIRQHCLATCIVCCRMSSARWRKPKHSAASRQERRQDSSSFGISRGSNRCWMKVQWQVSRNKIENVMGRNANRKGVELNNVPTIQSFG